MNFYKRYPGDYMGKTAHLSLIEHGAYNVLLDHCYSHETPLPSDHESCYRIARAFTKEEREAVDSILNQYFALKDEGYTHSRVTKELKKAGDIAERNRENGMRGGRPKGTQEEPKENPVGYGLETDWQSETKGIPDTRLPDYQTPETKPPDDHTQTPESKPLVSQATPAGRNGSSRFEEFWQLYPVHREKKKAKEIWDRRKLDTMADRICHDVAERQKRDDQWKQGFIPHPTKYLRNDLWEDEYSKPKGGDGYTEFLESFNEPG